MLVDSSVLFEDGKFAHTRCFTRDVTDSKHMEEALRKSEERFRLTIKATNDAIWDIDLKTGTVSWNETYTTLYGRPPATSDSWQWWIDNIHAEDRERTVGDLRIAIGSGASSWTCEYRFQRVDGEWAHIYDRAYIARDASGNAWRVIGAMQDLTDRKQAEARLRESEQRLRFAQQAAGIGTFDWNIESGDNTWTPELEAMYGLHPGDFPRTQAAWEDLVHPDDRVQALQLVTKSFETGTPTRGEWRVIWPDGSVHWVSGRWQVFKNSVGKPVRMRGVNIDVTDRQRSAAGCR